MSKKKKRIAALALTAVFAMTVTMIIVHFTAPQGYFVKGVDVSAYQGEIDWNTLSDGLSFAFIKATEGSGYTDPRFEYNLSEALKTDLLVGAYHFFSYDSSGAAQARHFIETVPKIKGMLPPVIDVEFYGDYTLDPPEKEKVLSELSDMITALEEYYGVKPIIYATRRSYTMFIKDETSCPIWLRDIIFKPALSEDTLLFWQYTDKARLDGYDGEEKHIDMNVFFGDLEELKNLIIM